MPKRQGNLFSSCVSIDSLYNAYLRARKSKRCKRSVMVFERDLGSNIQKLHSELMDGTYKPRDYVVFEVREPKKRTIYAPHFRDMVVQHAIYKAIYHIYDRTFIHDSYGSRIGKGTHKASDRAQHFIRKSRLDSYTLQLDIRKFFYRIDRALLASLIEKKIKDKKLLSLMALFMSYPDAVGIPIGYPLSQLYALIYMNPLDHFIKRELKVKKYVRYVDDFILFDLDKNEAATLKTKIEIWLASNLRLELSRWTISHVSKGVNFVGFRTWRGRRFVRRHSIHTFSRRLRGSDVRALVSIIGHARHTSTYLHFCQRVAKERPDLIKQLKVKNVHKH